MITLFLVKGKGALSSEKAEDILAKGREQLLNNGVPSDLIKERVVEEGPITKAILKEVEQSRYAAVALGRTGTGQGLLQRLFMGSVSMSLFRELERAALLVCY